MPEYETLMASPGITALDNKQALLQTGFLIDQSDHPEREPGTDRALAWCEELEARELSPTERVELNYFRANAWAAHQHRRRQGQASWSWDQPEIGQQILALRRARWSDAFDALPKIRQCEILTNLGNQLNSVGRFVDALDCWNSALAIDPGFWMARGNRGYGLWHYAQSLYDAGHRGVFLLFAHRDLETALAVSAQSTLYPHPEARAAFEETRDRISATTPMSALEKDFDPDGHNLGRSKSERAYRSWCLCNRLFLNPLNDLADHSIANQDVLTLPSFVTAIQEPPVLIGFYNEMKQEFASARWTFYEGTHASRPHFSDRGVLLLNTLDYPSYGLAVEKMKLAYRAAYSIFDKVAYFLKYYWKLPVNDRAVSFQLLWRAGDGSVKHPVRPEFEQSENWPLRGLFWLSKDLFDEEMKEATEPDAQALHELRRHLEHRYLKVHEMMVGPRSQDDPFFDSLAYSISRPDLQRKTLRLLKLARAALIYLSLSMHREEQRRRARSKATLIASMSLDPLRDERKR